ncbi:hypothetical protein NKR19_g7583 [Coniochaeta hoffmannii]|uniref:Uncharacterized protein n=1 Tax=Coniochaeta hoffmannii TaxID=91930 RepID=A0AA38VQ12_9PEZI|nr:hypothetical protein NKR19_g7583 [Coniochaeta hoffmannii]
MHTYLATGYLSIEPDLRTRHVSLAGFISAFRSQDFDLFPQRTCLSRQSIDDRKTCMDLHSIEGVWEPAPSGYDFSQEEEKEHKTKLAKAKKIKTYNIRDSPVVTHPSTSLTITSLSIGRADGIPSFLVSVVHRWWGSVGRNVKVTKMDTFVHRFLTAARGQ